MGLPAKQTGLIKAGVCQILVLDGDREGNLRRIELAAQAAARAGAQMACLPESCVLGWINPDAHRIAEPIPGADSERLCELARRLGIMLAVGLDEREGERLFDAAVLIGADGRLLLKHRKINNLSGERLMDPPYTDGTPGSIGAVDTPLGRIGMLICADTFVPEWLDAAARQPPDLLVVPYGWAAPADAWPQHGQRLASTVAAAAKRAGCPVIGTDCVGMITHGPWAGRTYGGMSVAADATGRVISQLVDHDAQVRIIEVHPGRR